MALVAGAALATLVAFSGSGPGWVLMWEAAVALTVIGAVGGRWPTWPAPVPALVSSLVVGARPHRPVAPLEMEVMAAVDPALGGDARLRHRLTTLAEHRAGLEAGALDSDSGPELLGPDLWAALDGTGPLRLKDVQLVVARLEAL